MTALEALGLRVCEGEVSLRLVSPSAQSDLFPVSLESFTTQTPFTLRSSCGLFFFFFLEHFLQFSYLL